MLTKRDLPTGAVLSLIEMRKLKDFFRVLIKVDKRIGTTKKKNKKSKINHLNEAYINCRPYFYC